MLNSYQNYADIPIIDGHTHIRFDRPVDDTVVTCETVMKKFGYDKIQVCALPYFSIDENYKAFYIKSKLSPRIFVSAGLEHHYDERDTADYYLKEIKRYHKMGADGIKMFEGKINLYRKIKKTLCDSVFDEFYAYAEENKIPIILHLGDPLFVWDKSKCSQYALDNGWFITENEPTREEFRAQIECVLEKFPKLHLILAHMYFMGDELERAEAMLNKWENVCFDITPGGEMFIGFTNRYDEWREFFIRYQERILYGTDTYFNIPADAVNIEKYPRIKLVRNYLESKDIFKEESMNYPFKPFNFSGEILEKIYYKNFIRIYGGNPRTLDNAEIVKGCKSVKEKGELSEISKQSLKIIEEYFDKKIRGNNI